MLRTVTATRYVTPLREGGSLPGLMEADDLGSYVVKYVGAGQGRKTLVAEILCAGLARALELRVPELVLVEVDPELGRSEPDEEVQDLLKASGGLNLGMDFLPGSLGFDPLAHQVGPELAELSRFGHVLTELNRLGGHVTLLDPHRVWVDGPTHWSAAEVMCPPALRPAVVLLLAMLATPGTSVLRNVYVIDRGYEDLARRLSALGAQIEPFRDV